MRLNLFLFVFLATSCGFTTPKIEMHESPFLLSILGTSLSLTPNINPKLEVDIRGHSIYLIEDYTFKVQPYLLDMPVPLENSNQSYRIVHGSTCIPPHIQINEIWELWGYSRFDRVLLSIESIKFKDRNSIICNPEKYDCQETLTCLRSVENCN